MKDVRCLVKKEEGDFDRAADLGYAINLNCASGYMWLIYRGGASTTDERLKRLMELHLEEDKFEKVSEVEFF